MRLFFAVELPAEVQAVLGRVRRDRENRDYRWVDPSLLHLTLAFLGEQPEERLDALQTVGAQAAACSQAGALRLGSAGHFGSARAPRVLWVDLAGDLAALTALHFQLTNKLREHGFPTEDRPFRAHVTLARRRETAHGGPPAGWPPDFDHRRFKVAQLTLMHSRLSPRGPTYTPLFHFPVGS
ncbi:MAG: RNA 2',3'-cyclic phosphodiesterase [Chloroflexi bacterium]|nr:RNA 2',3'-cyclic phosphodiesterase [Chloroflexota bacterium]